MSLTTKKEKRKKKRMLFLLFVVVFVNTQKTENFFEESEEGCIKYLPYLFNLGFVVANPKFVNSTCKGLTYIEMNVCSLIFEIRSSGMPLFL